VGKTKVQSTSTGIDPRNKTRLMWTNAGIMCLIVVCSFGVIQTSHACRQLYAQLQLLEASRWYMEEDYGRLLLEQSTWASYQRVERVAERDLGMQPPAIADLKVFVE
jgi:cell division protein FtsL